MAPKLSRMNKSSICKLAKVFMLCLTASEDERTIASVVDDAAVA